MGIIVKKFGGTSVRDGERVMNVAKRVVQSYKEGHSVVVVVSAQGKLTDELVGKALEVNAAPSKREMDVLLSSGEQISMSLLAIAIESLGCPSISLTGRQAGIYTNSVYSAARIKNIDTERVAAELDRRNIVIIAGFQGYNKYDDITTLGRGGSDTTAVALAAALNADCCQIYTDVDGVFTADPRIVPNAKKLSEITYDEMLELASLGANVLHNRAVELAKKYNIKLEVLSSLTNEPGTVVREVVQMEKMLIRGVTRDNDVARISVLDIPDTPGKAFTIFSLLAKKNINVDVILQSIGREHKDISFTVSKPMLADALQIISDNLALIGAKTVLHNEDISKVSIVGAGMTSNAGVAAKMFEALFEAGINIHMISTSEIKVSVLVDKKNAEAAVTAIHDKFMR